MLTENDHLIGEKIEESDTLGSKRIWKIFERVRNEKGWEGETEKAVEQEYERDEGVGEALVTGLDIN